MTAIRSAGTRLQIGAQYIADITDISGLDLSADTIDSTPLDATGGYRQFIGSFKDGGEVSISGFFNPSDPGQAALYAAFNSGTVDTYNITFPSQMGASWSFSGLVTGFKTEASVDDAISFDVTVKVSGQPSLALSASNNLTALALTGTAGTLSPAFAGGTYGYSYSFTGTSLTVTATLAGAVIDLYVDNVLFQAGLTSGSASQAITFAAVGSKVLTLLVRETGKATKTYDIVGIRTS